MCFYLRASRKWMLHVSVLLLSSFSLSLIRCVSFGTRQRAVLCFISTLCLRSPFLWLENSCCVFSFCACINVDFILEFLSFTLAAVGDEILIAKTMIIPPNSLRLVAFSFRFEFEFDLRGGEGVKCFVDHVTWRKGRSILMQESFTSLSELLWAAEGGMKWFVMLLTLRGFVGSFVMEMWTWPDSKKKDSLTIVVEKKASKWDGSLTDKAIDDARFGRSWREFWWRKEGSKVCLTLAECRGLESRALTLVEGGKGWESREEETATWNSHRLT